MSHDAGHEIRFGDLLLAGETDPSMHYYLHALADNTNWGNPEPVMTVIDSLLGDGQLVSIDRDDNREAAVGISIEGSDGRALAEAEAALVAETKRPNVLEWQPPSAFAPLTVFDVITSHLEHVFDDLDELSERRRYILHLVLYPHARSSEAIVEEALGAGVDPSGSPPVEENVSTCSSTTGWTGVTGTGVDALTMNSGHVYLRGDIGWNLWERFDTGSVQTWSDTPFIEFDWQTSGNNDADTVPRCFVSATSGGAEAELALVSSGTSPMGATWTRSTFALGEHADTTRFVKLYKANDLTKPAGGRWALWMNNVQVTDGNAASDGSTRQLSRTLDVNGSARALASIDLRHEDTLGDVLVWSGPVACSPPLRPRRLSGGTVTADATCVSGAREPIVPAAPFVADMPLDTLPPGAYVVMARMATTSTAGTYLVDVTAQTRLSVAATGDTPVGDTLMIDDARVGLGAGTDRRLVSLGVMHLPPTEVANGSAGVARITISGADVELDEAWLFNITDGDLTWLKGAAEIVQLVPPMLDSPRGHILTGPTDEALHEAGSIVQAWGAHRFEPGEWAAYTVTTTAEDAAMTATYYPRWHTHVAEGS